MLPAVYAADQGTRIVPPPSLERIRAMQLRVVQALLLSFFVSIIGCATCGSTSCCEPFGCDAGCDTSCCEAVCDAGCCDGGVVIYDGPAMPAMSPISSSSLNSSCNVQPMPAIAPPANAPTMLPSVAPPAPQENNDKLPPSPSKSVIVKPSLSPEPAKIPVTKPVKNKLPRILSDEA